MSLERDICTILEAVLSASDPARCVLHSLVWAHAASEAAADPTRTPADCILRIAGKHDVMLKPHARVLVCAVGKAATPMCVAALRVLRDRLPQERYRGQLVTKYGHVPSEAAIELDAAGVLRFEAGHPQPDAAGHAAAERVLAEVSSLASDDVLLLLLSGGGSALLPLPAHGLTLEDLQATNDQLLRCGAGIEEINAVRKHLSRISGGQLRTACRGTIVTLALSDVIGDRPDVIASGPTAIDISTFTDALGVLERYHVAERVPASVRDHLRAGSRGRVSETLKELPADCATVYEIIGSNALALDAAAEAAVRCGYAATQLTSTLSVEAKQAGQMLASMASEAAEGRALARTFAPLSSLAIICGGETTVTLPSAGIVGRGGRNQELALAAAAHLHRLKPTTRSEHGVAPASIAIVSFGTDGTDGPTDAAGAVATARTLDAAGSDADLSLRSHDAYTYFSRLPPLRPGSQTAASGVDFAGGLIVTGPTGTNVMDVMIALVKRPG